MSRYLKGDYYDMSERSRRAIQKWFIVYRKNAAAIGGLSHYLKYSALVRTKPELSRVDVKTIINSQLVNGHLFSLD